MTLSSPALLLDWLILNEFLSGSQGEELRPALARHADITSLVRELVQRNFLTPFQANQISKGQAADLVLGPYRLLERIGEGATGQVYKARHTVMSRLVALKIVNQANLANPRARERFSREAKTAATLNHPGIVSAFHADRVGERFFLAMEFVEGIDLSRLVKTGGPLPVAKACEIARQTALALDHAYERGVVHRDIKPANLLLTLEADGQPAQVKILDFGLARFVADSGNAGRLTQAGNLLGTVDYIAPEQAENAPDADIRADLYSLGCTLFYLLTSKPPFAGDTLIDKVSARLTGPPPAVRALRPDIPVGLEAVLLRLMARNPADRYQTPRALVEALAPFASPTSVALDPTAAPLASAARMDQLASREPTQSFPSLDESPPDLDPAFQFGDVTSPEGTGDTLNSNPVTPTLRSRRKGAQPQRKPVWLLASAGGAAVVFGLVAYFLIISNQGEATSNNGNKPGTGPGVLRLLPLADLHLKQGNSKTFIVKLDRGEVPGTVEVRLEGLPEGVTSRPVRLTEHGKTAEFKVTASFGIGPISQTVKVLVVGEGQRSEGEFNLTVEGPPPDADS